MKDVIEVQGLVKSYGSLNAVDNISFTVRQGEIFGIVGPNGAGKTTTLEIIEGLQPPTAGSTAVLGVNTQRDPSAVKEIIGVHLQSSAYFDYLTLKEILVLFGSFYRRHIDPTELLQKVGLLEKAGTMVKHLSGGQKQRFTVAASLVNDPDVVILDEPTTGLDPQARRNLWQLIQQIHSEGKTIVMTTHYMEEAQALCSRVAIMDMGRIVALDTPSEMLRRLDLPYLVKLVTPRALSRQETELLIGSLGDVLVSDGNSYHLRVKDAHEVMDRIVQWAATVDVTLEQVEIVPATLEDVFLELTGKELRD